MGKLTRQERVEIAGKLGVDERTILGVIQGKPFKSLGLRRTIEAALTKKGVAFAKAPETPEEAPEADPTTSTALQVESESTGDAS